MHVFQTFKKKKEPLFSKLWFFLPGFRSERSVIKRDAFTELGDIMVPPTLHSKQISESLEHLTLGVLLFLEAFWQLDVTSCCGIVPEGLKWPPKLEEGLKMEIGNTRW